VAPPVMVNGLWLNWIDTNNHQSAGLWTTQDQSQLVTGPYTSLITASKNLSCMGVFAAMLQVRKDIAATPVVGPYSTFEDQAVLQVQSANGVIDLVIPGPIDSIFTDDGQTVDLGNALVQAWWTQVQAVLGDEIGSPWIYLRRGWRRKVTAGR
jgi:hypothetical protein